MGTRKNHFVLRAEIRKLFIRNESPLPQGGFRYCKKEKRKRISNGKAAYRNGKKARMSAWKSAFYARREIYRFLACKRRRCVLCAFVAFIFAYRVDNLSSPDPFRYSFGLDCGYFGFTHYAKPFGASHRIGFGSRRRKNAGYGCGTYHRRKERRTGL